MISYKKQKASQNLPERKVMSRSFEVISEVSKIVFEVISVESKAFLTTSNEFGCADIIYCSKNFKFV